MGIVDLKKYELKDIVKGDSIFCATGITNGELVKGIETSGDYFMTDTFVTHKSKNIKKIYKRSTKNYMISVSGNKWSERKLNNRIIEKISIDNNLS